MTQDSGFTCQVYIDVHAAVQHVIPHPAPLSHLRIEMRMFGQRLKSPPYPAVEVLEFVDTAGYDSASSSSTSPNHGANANANNHINTLDTNNRSHSTSSAAVSPYAVGLLDFSFQVPFAEARTLEEFRNLLKQERLYIEVKQYMVDEDSGETECLLLGKWFRNAFDIVYASDMSERRHSKHRIVLQRSDIEHLGFPACKMLVSFTCFSLLTEPSDKLLARAREVDLDMDSAETEDPLPVSDRLRTSLTPVDFDYPLTRENSGKGSEHPFRASDGSFFESGDIFVHRSGMNGQEVQGGQDEASTGEDDAENEDDTEDEEEDELKGARESPHANGYDAKSDDDSDSYEYEDLPQISDAIRSSSSSRPYLRDHLDFTVSSAVPANASKTSNPQRASSTARSQSSEALQNSSRSSTLAKHEDFEISLHPHSSSSRQHSNSGGLTSSKPFPRDGAWAGTLGSVVAFDDSFRPEDFVVVHNSKHGMVPERRRESARIDIPSPQRPGSDSLRRKEPYSNVSKPNARATRQPGRKVAAQHQEAAGDRVRAEKDSKRRPSSAPRRSPAKEKQLRPQSARISPQKQPQHAVHPQPTRIEEPVKLTREVFKRLTAPKQLPPAPLDPNVYPIPRISTPRKKSSVKSAGSRSASPTKPERKHAIVSDVCDARTGETKGSVPPRAPCSSVSKQRPPQASPVQSPVRRRASPPSARRKNAAEQKDAEEFLLEVKKRIDSFFDEYAWHKYLSSAVPKISTESSGSSAAQRVEVQNIPASDPTNSVREALLDIYGRPEKVPEKTFEDMLRDAKKAFWIAQTEAAVDSAGRKVSQHKETRHEMNNIGAASGAVFARYVDYLTGRKTPAGKQKRGVKKPVIPDADGRRKEVDKTAARLLRKKKT
eukprot:ANDGO_03656.mRNA.1 hypothetical protein